MRDRGKRVGQELKRLMKRKGSSYEKILDNFIAHANETSPYEKPPYQDYSSLTRIFNGRKPDRSKLLYILIWGLAANQNEINRVLTVADYETFSPKETECLPLDTQPQHAISSGPKLSWQMSQSIFLPIAEEDLDVQTGRFGSLRQIEVPRRALEEILLDRLHLSIDKKVYGFLRDVWSHPKKYHSVIATHPSVKTWVNSIWAPPPNGSKELEHEQFLKFLQAMDGPEINEELLPDYSFDEISCWRVFVQAFPESINLLEAASRVPTMRHTKRMAIAALSSTLARLEDQWVASSRAAVITSRLLKAESSLTVQTSAAYQRVRHFFYAAVEAGECRAERFINFAYNPQHPIEWELGLNRRYYKSGTDEPLALTVARKMERPRNRDEHTRKITEFHSHVLPRGLVDKAFHMIR